MSDQGESEPREPIWVDVGSRLGIPTALARYAPYAMLALALVLWAVVVIAPAVDAPAYDLAPMVLGARVLADGGHAHLYDHDPTWFNLVTAEEFSRAARALGFGEYTTPFVQAPLVAWLARPLAFLKYSVVARGWLLAAAAASIANVVLLLRTFLPARASVAGVALALLLLVPFEPLRYGLWLGQTTPFVLLFVFAALYAVRRGHPFAAGMLLAFPAFVKLTPLVIAFAWLVQRERRAIAGLVVGLGALVALSLAVAGVPVHVAYVHRIVELSGTTILAHNNHAPSAAIMRLSAPAIELMRWRYVPVPGLIKLLGYVLGAGVLAIALPRSIRSPQDPEGVARRRDVSDASALLAILLIPTIAWTHYFVLLLPVALVVLRWAPRTQRWTAAVPLLLCTRPFAPDSILFDPAHVSFVAAPTLAALLAGGALAAAGGLVNVSTATSKIRAALLWPLQRAWLVPSAVLVAVVALFVRAATSHTRGELSYPLDDAYIHMTLAKNMAFHGVQGMTPLEYTPASSSILWPVLLAGLNLVVGASEVIPLVLNVIAGVALVVYVARSLAAEAPSASPVVRTLVVLAILLLTPLPTLVLTGMEHTLHALVTVLLVAEASRWLASDEREPRVALYALAFLDVSIRYEGLFLVAAVAGLALLRRKGLASGLVGVCGAVPVVAFGVYSVAHGAYFLPNSVVVKARTIPLRELSDLVDFLGGDLIARVYAEPHVLAVLAAVTGAYVVARLRDGAWSRDAVRLGLVTVIIALHVQFGALGWFYRYEAYAIAASLWALAMFALPRLPSGAPLFRAVRSNPTSSLAVAFLVVLMLVPLGRRARDAAAFAPAACRNVYEQQIQMARFLQTEFDGKAVAVNDIGAVAWKHTGPLVDLAGLGSTAVAKVKKGKMLVPLEPEFIASITRDAAVAVIYEDWFAAGLPHSWTRVGRWRIDRCFSCASPVVSFYATRPETIEYTVAALRRYSPNLPETVRQEGRYTQIELRDADAEAHVLCEGDAVRFDAPFDDAALRKTYSFSTTVGADGALSYPFLDPIPARGKTVAQVQDHLRSHFEEVRGRDPRVLAAPPPLGVRLVRRRGHAVLVTGNVTTPGEMWWDEPVNGTQVLLRAGGLTDAAQPLDAAYVLREGADGAWAHVALADTRVRSRDVVVVP